MGNFFKLLSKKTVFVLLGAMLLVGAIVGTKLNETSAATVTREYRNVAYYTSWAGYERAVQVADLDPALLTHINFAFANLNSSGEVVVGDSWIDIDKPFGTDTWDSPAGSRGHFSALRQLKAQYPHLKVLISIGGWTWSNNFSGVASTAAGRQKFAQSAANFCKTYGLDGVDIDWEYPVEGGNGIPHLPADKQNLTLLLKATREALNSLSASTGKTYELSIAAPANQNYVNNLEVTEIMKYLDFINLMTYDYHGGFDPQTNHNAPLYLNPNDVSNTGFCIDTTVRAFLNAGAKAEDLNLGLAFYGRGWQNVASGSATGLFQNASAIASKGFGLGTWEGGVFDYWDLKQNYVNKNGYTRYWDDAAKCPYLYNSSTKTFISYDDEESIGYKLQYLMDMGLGGGMFWEAAGDKYFDLTKVVASKLNINKGSVTVITNPTTTVSPVTTQGNNTTAKTTAGSDNGVAAWNASSVYVGGNQVSYNGQIFEAKWWTQGETPVVSDSGVWKLVSGSTPTTTTTKTTTTKTTTTTTAPVGVVDLTKVTAYKDINYGGNAASVGIGTYTTAQMVANGIKNDDISSIKVPSKFKVTLYADDNFGGESLVLTADTSWIGNTWNDRVSSMKVEAVTATSSGNLTAKFYTYANGTTGYGANIETGYNYVATANTKNINYDNLADLLNSYAGRADGAAIRWEGQIKVNTTGTYNFYIIGDNGFTLTIGGKTVIDNWADNWDVQKSGTAYLEAGKYYDLELDYFENFGGQYLKFEWDNNGSRAAVPASVLFAPNTGTSATVTNPTTPTNPSNPGSSNSALASRVITGYWQNFDNGATCLKISDVPAAYNLIAVAFADSTSTPGQIVFNLDSTLSSRLGGYTKAQFIADIAAAKAKGQKVIISVGGELGNVSVTNAAQANTFATSAYALMQEYGFDGVDIDLEHGINSTYMAQALRQLSSLAGSGLIIAMAPQTLDMQSVGTEYFKLCLAIKDILTIVNTQYYNSGSMLGANGGVYSQGTADFATALAEILLINGLRADQVGLGFPASSRGAGSGYVDPSVVNKAYNSLAFGTSSGSYTPTKAYSSLRGVMTWSINWDALNGYKFLNTVAQNFASIDNGTYTPTTPSTNNGGTTTPTGETTWNASTVYVGGNQVYYNGQLFEARWWTQGETPNTSSQWGVWKLIG